MKIIEKISRQISYLEEKKKRAGMLDEFSIEDWDKMMDRHAAVVKAGSRTGRVVGSRPKGSDTVIIYGGGLDADGDDYALYGIYVDKNGKKKGHGEFYDRGPVIKELEKMLKKLPKGYGVEVEISSGAPLYPTKIINNKVKIPK
jgi:hypothetical protein